jgi:hypothetical protein
MVTAHAGFTGVWLGEETRFWFVGTSPAGITIQYQCKPTPVLVLTITYELFGTSEQCSYLRVEPHPEDGAWANSCDEEFLEWVGGTLTVNCSISTEETTWSRIKSLYR